MRPKVVFCVAGDPILDTYNYCAKKGKRLTVNSYETRPGGALNIWNNLRHLVGEPVWFADFVGGHPLSPRYEPGGLDEIYEVTRWVTSYGQVEFESAPPFSYKPSREYKSQTPRAFAYHTLEDAAGYTARKVLVIGDYNKGVCSEDSQFSTYVPSVPAIDLLVVDSRHRSLDPLWLEGAKVKVWRCTGDEFDMEWAKQFDWVIHSDGPKEVFVQPGTPTHYKQVTCIPVPDTKVVDTCGAGDTMTAAVAAHLGVHGKDFSLSELADAARFAVLCCQDVVQEFGTVSTRRRVPLKEDK